MRLLSTMMTGDVPVKLLYTLFVHSLMAVTKFTARSSLPWWTTFVAVDEDVSAITDRRQCQCLDVRSVVRSDTCCGAIDGFSVCAV